MGLASLFRQFGSSVGTTVVGAIVGASAAVAAVPEMASAIQEAVMVQLGAGMVVLVAAWLIADLPLGTARGATEADLDKDLDLDPISKGQSWSRVIADR